MKYTLVSVGSKGDLNPYIALGQKLASNNHTVTIAALDVFAEDVKNAGLNFASLGALPEIFKPKNASKSKKETSSSTFSGILGRAIFWAVFPYLLKPSLEKFIQACEGSDVLLFTRLALPVPYIGEKLGIPCFAAFPVPHKKTVEFESPLYVKPNLIDSSQFRKSLSYKLESFFTHQFSYNIIKKFRHHLGLPYIPRKKIMAHCDGLIKGTIYGVSESVLPRPADWSENVQLTGYWFPIQEKNWLPSEKIINFINSGSTPICIGFGSMKSKNSKSIYKAVVSTLQELNLRAVILSGWGGMGDFNLDEKQIMVINEVPHEWLFSKVSAVVHHGGAGTTAAALRAGVPSIIVPHSFDQRFWGRLIYRIGCGSKPIEEKEFNHKLFTLALKEVLENNQIKINSEKISDSLKAEDGCEKAIKIIDKWIAD